MRSHSLFSPCELLIYSLSATVRLAFFFILRTADVSPRSSPLEGRWARRNICRSLANSFSLCIFDRKLVKPVVCSLRIQKSLHSASHIRDISQTITSGEEKRDGRFRRSFGVQYKFHWIFVLVIYAIEFDWIINCEYPTVVLLNQSKYLLWFLVEKLWTTIRILCTRLTFLKPFEHIYSFKAGFH